jgi:hypothetical protein
MPLIDHHSWRDRASRFHLISPHGMGKVRDHAVDLNTERLAIPASLKGYSNQTYRRIQEPVPQLVVRPCRGVTTSWLEAETWKPCSYR